MQKQKKLDDGLREQGSSEIDRKSYTKIKMEQKFRFDIYIEVSKDHMRSYQKQLDAKKKKSEVKNICNVFPYPD